jgi:S-formylglutathione hydrolase
MFTYVTEELPSLVEKCFPVTAKKSIMGHSMGAGGALMIAAKTQNYQSVSAIAPRCSPSSPGSLQAVTAMREYFDGQLELARQYDCTEVIKKGK